MAEKPVVAVTGASRGIGACIVRQLVQHKIPVVLIARTAETIFSSAAEIDRRGGKALPLAVDVADPDACGRIIHKTLKTFGRLDALVNNAAVVEPLNTIASADLAKWHYNIQVNLMGPIYLTQAAIPELRKRKGRIINVSSGAAEIPIPTASAYCASKAALNHFTRILAQEEPAIISLAVSPGVVDTDMQSYLREEGSRVMPTDQSAYYQRIKTEGELISPQIPARSIAWLALHAPGTLQGRFIRYNDPRIGLSA